MRAVIDTNVLVGACIGRGASSKVVEACLDGRLQPYISESVLLEYRDVLSRAEPFRHARMDFAERAMLLRAFVSQCTFTDIYYLWRPNLPDESDNHIMELAIAANAAMIVTSNVRDFLRQELKFPKIEIVRPEQLIERMSQ